MPRGAPVSPGLWRHTSILSENGTNLALHWPTKWSPLCSLVSVVGLRKLSHLNQSRELARPQPLMEWCDEDIGQMFSFRNQE